MATHIPLTTLFTPPPSCLNNAYTSYGSSVYVKDLKVESRQCYPEGFGALWSVGEPFSPGVCPESYGVASRGTWEGFVREGAGGEGEGEGTAALCCPM